MTLKTRPSPSKNIEKAVMEAFFTLCAGELKLLSFQNFFEEALLQGTFHNYCPSPQCIYADCPTIHFRELGF